ncbi:MAG: hypothetical protein JNM24_03705 [Bdellovibrionaceae bacterium]|nr:hypothetical protein [Pseudobdellovibrionaceae bacterium]
MIFKISLIAVFAFLLNACDQNKKENQNQDTPAPAMSEISVTTYQDQGTRIRAINSDGRVIVNGLLLGDNAQIFSSRGFVAFTENKNGKRLRTFNYKGNELHTSAYLLKDDSKIFISDNLISFTTYNEGLRLYTFTADEAQINTSADLLDEEKSKVWIGNKLISFSVNRDGLRLRTFNSDGKIINTGALILDESQSVKIKEDTVYFLSKFNSIISLNVVDSNGNYIIDRQPWDENKKLE